MAEPPKKKKKPNQTDMSGLTDKEISWYKARPPAGKWRDFMKLKVSYAYVTKTWEYDGETLSQRFLVPFGMSKTLIGVWSKTKCYHSFNILPLAVKEKFNIKDESYDPKKMKLTLHSSGNRGVKEFWYAYCKVCQSKVDGIIRKNKDKLPSNAKIEHLMDNWDLFGLSSEIMDLVGCVIPDGDKEKDVFVGLNARKYLMRPYEHSNKFHKEKAPTPQQGY